MSGRHLGGALTAGLSVLVIAIALMANRSLMEDDVVPSGDIAAQSIVTWRALRLETAYGQRSWNGYFLFPTLDYMRAAFSRAGGVLAPAREHFLFHLVLFPVVMLASYYLAYAVFQSAATALCVAVTFIVFLVAFGGQRVLVVPWCPYSAVHFLWPFAVAATGIATGRATFVPAAIIFGSLAWQSSLVMSFGVAAVMAGSITAGLGWRGVRGWGAMFQGPWLYAALGLAVYPIILDILATGGTNLKLILSYAAGNGGKVRTGTAEAWRLFIKNWQLTPSTEGYLIAAGVSAVLLMGSGRRRPTAIGEPAAALVFVGVLTAAASFVAYRFVVPADYVAFHAGLYGRIGLACIVAGVIVLAAATLPERRRPVLAGCVGMAALACLTLPGLAPPYHEGLNPHWMMKSTLEDEIYPLLDQITAKGDSIALIMLQSDPVAAGRNEREFGTWRPATAVANVLHRRGIEFCVASRPDSPGHVAVIADYTASSVCAAGQRPEFIVSWVGDRSVLNAAGRSFVIY